MKRMLYFLALLSILSFACSISITPTPQLVTAPPSTPQVITAPPPTLEMPTATQPQPATLPPMTPESPTPQTNVTCNEISLYLEELMGSGFNCETIPASTEGMEMHPQYTQLTMNGYALADKFFNPHISVYPIQEYTNLYPENIPSAVADLQALIGGGASSEANLPFLPVFPAVQVFRAQYRVLPFMSGGGIRYLTLYAQYFAPVNNHDLFYTYQGLTSDGMYWVSAILPINNPILPDNADNPPGGMTWEEFSNSYEMYSADITNQLDSQTSDSYMPTLAALDALVASIVIFP